MDRIVQYVLIDFVINWNNLLVNMKKWHNNNNWYYKKKYIKDGNIQKIKLFKFLVNIKQHKIK
jgi:hypothetical protein